MVKGWETRILCSNLRGGSKEGSGDGSEEGSEKVNHMVPANIDEVSARNLAQLLGQDIDDVEGWSEQLVKAILVRLT